MHFRASKGRNLCVLALFASSSAISAEQSSAELFNMQLSDLTQIKVQASSKLESADQGNLSVSASNFQQWQERGVRSTQEALNQMPGVVSLPTFGGGQAINIRGYSTELSNRGVATLIDGVPINTYTYGTGEYGTANIELGTLQQIEVIRGPGSALYGSNAFHGVFAQQSYQSNIDETQLSAATASDGYGNATFRHSQNLNSIPAIRSNLRYHFALGASYLPDQQRSYDYTDPSNGEELSADRAHAYDSQSMLNKITWSDYEKFGELSILIDRLDTNDQPGMGTHFFGGNYIQRDTDFSEQNANFVLINNKHTQQITDSGEIIWHAFHWRNEHDLIFDNTGVIDAFGPGHTFTGSTVESRTGAELGWRQQFQRTQTYLALSHHQQHIIKAHNQRRTPSGLIIEDNNSGYDDAVQQITSLISESETSFNNWLFNYGVRVDHYTSFGNQFTPRLGITYRLSSQQKLSIRYGHGFRAAIASEKYTDGRIQGQKDITPERLRSTEINWAYNSADWHTWVTAFQSEWDEGIALKANTTNPDIDATYDNINESSSKGLELGAGHNSSRWIANGDLSYALSKNEESDTFYVTHPKLIANLALGFTLGENNWRIYMTNRGHFWTKATKLPSDDANQSSLPTYWRTDINVEKNFNKQSYGRLIIRNAFDRDNRLPSIWDTPDGLKDESLNIGIEIGHAFE